MKPQRPAGNTVPPIWSNHSWVTLGSNPEPIEVKGKTPVDFSGAKIYPLALELDCVLTNSNALTRTPPDGV